MNKIAFGEEVVADQLFGDEDEAAVAPTSIVRVGGITYYLDLIQGSDEWLAVRCGLLTASEMKLVVTPTLRIADNDKTKAHLWELLAQRVTGYVEPQYISDDMLRGREDEIIARSLYEEHCAPVRQVGFITNDEFGFTIGFSPDGLVGEGGFIEAKSRRQKYQMQTLVEHVPDHSVPPDYLIQIQTGFLVSKRKWCDFLSFSGGLHMPVYRVFPDPKVMNAIVEAAGEFERRLAEKLERYHEVLASGARLIPTERRIVQEMYV